MSELFTYGSVGGAGGNSGSYPELHALCLMSGVFRRLKHEFGTVETSGHSTTVGNGQAFWAA